MAVSHGIRAQAAQLVLHRGIGHALRDGRRQLVDHRRGRRGRHEQAEPRAGRHLRKRSFGKSRYVGQCRVALVAGDRQGLQTAGLYLRQHFRQIGEHDLHLASQQVVQGLRAALVRHVGHVRVHQRIELRAGQVRRGAGSTGRIVDAVAVGARILGQFARRVGRHAGIDHQQQRYRRQVG